MKIIVCSTSVLKLEAVTDAVRKIWPIEEVRDRIWPGGVQIQTDATTSGVPNQPFGDHQTLAGALHRAREAVARRAEGSYVVAIENGVVERNGWYVDLAYVVVVDPDCRITVRWSRDVPVPAQLVNGSMASEGTKTCGQLEAERTPGVDHDDPHVVWSSGATSRRKILADAVEEALGYSVLYAAVRP